MKIFPVGFGFLQVLCEGYAEFVEDPAEADFVLSMNNAGNDAAIREARGIADQHGKPFCWWTIEDPNAFLAFLGQAKMADYVFTSDKACIWSYRQALGHERVFWLPLAANEWMHKPMPLADDAADFVFSGNWYDNQNQARRWGSETVVLPLARAGHSMAIFSYEEPPYPELKPFWRGATSCYTTAEQYTHGRVVLGNNNQRSGMDGRDKTYMTSMRTFEALACGKSFLAPQSDAYEALGLADHRDLAVSSRPEDTLAWAQALLGADGGGEIIAEQGRARVLANHTYGHRLNRIARAIKGEADPEDWR
jgi:spore maturation protein CgeB